MAPRSTLHARATRVATRAPRDDFIWLTLLIAGWGLLQTVSAYRLAQDATNSLLIYASLLGGYAVVLPMMLVLSCTSRRRSGEPDRFADRIEVLATLAVAWGLYWGVVGIAIGQHPKDVIGSTLRMVLPFVTVIVLIEVFNGLDRSGRGRLLIQLVLVLGCVSVLGAFGKLSLLAGGRSYGGGLHQYNVDIMVMAALVLIIVGRFWAPPTRPLLALLLVCLVGISLLSLKRAVWANFAFALGLLIILAPAAMRARLLVLSVLGAVLIAVLGQRFGVVESIEARMAYTFGAHGQFDPSTTQRIAETLAAMHTLNQSPLGLAWLTGLGPGAGYIDLADHPFYNLNERGEPYHLHSFVAITVFRYGLVGLALHLALVGFAARAFWAFRRALTNSTQQAHGWPLAVAGAAASIAVLAKLPDMIAGNAYFGSFEFGLHLAVMAAALGLLGSRTEARGGR